jgi:hypothetical protein
MQSKDYLPRNDKALEEWVIHFLTNLLNLLDCFAFRLAMTRQNGAKVVYRPCEEHSDEANQKTVLSA